MAKVQLFSNTDAAALMRDVNNFIVDKKLIDIKHTAFSITEEFRNGLPYKNQIVDRVLVVYEEYGRTYA